MDSSASASKPKPLPKRIALLAVEVLLILITIGLIVATWMPAIVGTNEPGRGQVERGRNR